VLNSCCDGRLLDNKIIIYAKYRVPLGWDYAVTQTGWRFASKTQPLVEKPRKKKSKKLGKKALDLCHAHRQVNSLFGSAIKALECDWWNVDWYTILWSRDYFRTTYCPPVLQKCRVHHLQPFRVTSTCNQRSRYYAIKISVWVVRWSAVEPNFDCHYVYLPIKRQFAAFKVNWASTWFPKRQRNCSTRLFALFRNILAGQINRFTTAELERIDEVLDLRCIS